MPFDALPSANLQFRPPNYPAIPVRPPTPYGEIIKSIADPALAFLSKMSPEEKQKRTLADLEIKLNTLKYNELLKNPALMFNKDPNADLTRKELISRIDANDALTRMRNKGSGSAPDWGAIYNSGTTPVDTKPADPTDPNNPDNYKLSPQASIPTTDPETYWS